mgnify:CR=1 FL=1
MEHLPPSPRRRRVLLCATGSVASVKIPQLAIALSKIYHVKILLTKSSEHFVFKVSKTYDQSSWQAQWLQMLESVSKECDSEHGTSSPVIHVDEDEWKYEKVGDPVLHIELRKWADILLIAPMSANTLAKVAQGLSDNLVTCVARAWDVSKPFVVCPAMNTQMWVHPLTHQHVTLLRQIFQCVRKYFLFFEFSLLCPIL